MNLREITEKFITYEGGNYHCASCHEYDKYANYIEHTENCPVGVVLGMEFEFTVACIDSDRDNRPFKRTKSQSFSRFEDGVEWATKKVLEWEDDARWGKSEPRFESVRLVSNPLDGSHHTDADEKVGTALAAFRAKKEAEKNALKRQEKIRDYKAGIARLENLKPHLKPESYDQMLSDLQKQYPDITPSDLV